MTLIEKIKSLTLLLDYSVVSDAVYAIERGTTFPQERLEEFYNKFKVCVKYFKKLPDSTRKTKFTKSRNLSSFCVNPYNLVTLHIPGYNTTYNSSGYRYSSGYRLVSPVRSDSLKNHHLDKILLLISRLVRDGKKRVAKHPLNREL